MNAARQMSKQKKSSDLVLYNTIAHCPRVAAIDLGTNSCRLSVAAINIASLHRNFFKIKNSNERKIKIVDSLARVVCLGEGLKQTNLLSKNAIDRTIDALNICRIKMENHNVTYVRTVATEACRQAKNAEVLIEKAKDVIGIEIEIIPPREEARLVLKGCIGVMSKYKNYGIVLDIGGGSTEIIWLKIDKRRNNRQLDLSVIDSMSLPYGVVTLRDTYIHDNHNVQAYQIVQQTIHQTLKFFVTKNKIMSYFKNNEVQIVASSGTVTTLASIALGLRTYDRTAIDGKTFKAKDLLIAGNNILSLYLNNNSPNSALSNEQFLLQRQIILLQPRNAFHESFEVETHRFGLLAAGTVILSSIFEVIGHHDICIADRGVREGIIHDVIDSILSTDYSKT
jgi:exopolyphosphatase/guanosine-5'-triphosphate,3'-diphosphate pyrophosphatase